MRLLDDIRTGDKWREWFGTPVAAGKTLIWLLWARFVASVVVGLFCLLAWGVLALLG